jgi:hypothetical protein
LRDFPKAFIVTADDDLYYYSHWLRDLIEGWSGGTHQIICHRAHRIKVDAQGLPIPYNQWELEISGPIETTDIFPTGVGGVFYPPGSLSPEVLDETRFLELSPRVDDVWLYWMGCRAGTIFKKTPGKMELFNWPGSQGVALMNENIFESANDWKIKAMIQHYGWHKTRTGLNAA